MEELKLGIEIQEYSTDMIDYLICDLMDLSKIKQGKFKKNLEKFDLKKMVKSVMAI